MLSLRRRIGLTLWFAGLGLWFFVSGFGTGPAVGGVVLFIGGAVMWKKYADERWPE